MRKLVTIQKIDALKNINGADFIELALIKGWQAVVKKGDYKVGDFVLYYEIDSFLPVKPEYEFLLKGSKVKKMLIDGEEKEGILLKTKKLRGQISQGLVMPLNTIDSYFMDGFISNESNVEVIINNKLKNNRITFAKNRITIKLMNESELSTLRKELIGMVLNNPYKEKTLRGIIIEKSLELNNSISLSTDNHSEYVNVSSNTDDLDISEIIGVIKYEMPILANLSGIVKGSFPSFIPKTDEERIQNMTEVLGLFYVTEKLDGTSTTYYKKDGEFGVCSRKLELKNSDSTQWKIAEELNIEELLPEGIAIQGELIGEGIQGNPLKVKGQKFYVYNIFNINTDKFLNFKEMCIFCISKDLKIVPVIESFYSIHNKLKDILEYAEGKSLLNENVEREGIVIRPKIEMKHNGSRFSFKVISNKYLLKK